MPKSNIFNYDIDVAPNSGEVVSQNKDIHSAAAEHPMTKDIIYFYFADLDGIKVKLESEGGEQITGLEEYKKFAEAVVEFGKKSEEYQKEKEYEKIIVKNENMDELTDRAIDVINYGRVLGKKFNAPEYASSDYAKEFKDQFKLWVDCMCDGYAYGIPENDSRSQFVTTDEIAARELKREEERQNNLKRENEIKQAEIALNGPEKSEEAKAEAEPKKNLFGLPPKEPEKLSIDVKDRYHAYLTNLSDSIKKEFDIGDKEYEELEESLRPIEEISSQNIKEYIIPNVGNFSIAELTFIRDLKKSADRILDLDDNANFEELENILAPVNRSGYVLGMNDESKISHLGNIAFVAKRMAKEKVEKPVYRIAEYLDEAGRHLNLKRRAAEENYINLFAEDKYLDNLQRVKEASKQLDARNSIGGANIRNLDTKAIREKEKLTSSIEEVDAIAEIYDDLNEEQKFKLEFIQRNNEIIASKFPNKKMSDVEIANLVLDTSRDALREKLSFMPGYYQKREDLYSETAAKMGINPDLPPMIQRIVSYDIDMAGTPEAEENNRNLIKSLMTKEGQTKYAEQVLRTVLNEPLSTYCPRNEEDMLKLCTEKTKVLYYGFVVADITAHPNDLPVDPTLMEMVRERHNILQGAGHIVNFGEVNGSMYNGTLPQLDVAEIATLSGVFGRHLSNHPEDIEKYNLFYTLNKGDDVFDRKMNYTVAATTGETTYSKVRDFAETMEVQDVPIGKLVGYGEGGQIKLDTAVSKLNENTGDDFSFGVGNPKQQAEMQGYLDGESVNKEKNAIDYAKKYDEDEALLAKINEEYSRREAEIHETLASLNSMIGQYGLSLNDPKATATLVAIVDDGKGNLVKQPLFTEFPTSADSLMMNRVDLQSAISLGGAKVESQLTKQRLMQIEDLINERRVFIEVPGQHFDKAMHVYVQGIDSKGNVHMGISKPGENSEEPIYYGEDEDVVKENKEIGISLRNQMVEAEQQQLRNLDDDERMALEEKLAEDAKAWHKARVDAVNPDELWNDASRDGIIYDKAINFVIATNNKGLSDEEIRDKYNSINRQTKLSLGQMNSALSMANANFKVDETPEASKAELTKSARKQVLDIVIDKKNRVDALDRSDPMLSKMEADRGLKGIVLDNTASAEVNSEIARRWYGGDLDEKTKVINECLKQLNDIDVSEYSLDASDEDIVKNYRDLCEKVNGYNELVLEFAMFDAQGIKIDPELRKQLIERLNSLDAVSMYYHGKMTMISSDVYDRIDSAEVLKNPEVIDNMDEITVSLADREFGSYFAGASNALSGLELGLKSSIISQMGLISETGVNEKLALYDADGKQYRTTERIYDHVLKGETIFARNLETGDVVPFTLDKDKKRMNDRSAEADFKIQADAVKYALSRRAAPKSAIKQDRFIGRGLQKTFAELYKIVDDADSMFVRSSKEFRNIKAELDAIAKQDTVPSFDQARKSVNKIHEWAKKYVDTKDNLMFNGKVFSAREKGRYDAIKEIRRRSLEMLDTYGINKEGVSLMGGTKAPAEAERQPKKYESFAKYYEDAQRNPEVSYDMRIASAAIKEIIAIQSKGSTAMSDVSIAKLADKFCTEGKIDRIVKEFAKLPSIKDVVSSNPESAQNISKVNNGELTRGISIKVLKDIQKLGLKSLLEKAEPVKTLEQKKIEAPAKNNNLSL